MLFGNSPFKATDNRNPQNAIIKNIKQGKFAFPDNIKVSQEAMDLIRKLLVRRPEQRLGFRGAVEIQQHPFFKSINWDDLYNNRLEAPIRVKLTNKNRKEVRL